MEISTRTPEGTPNRCPVCQSYISIEPSLFFGDAPCPVCGSLLWFIGAANDKRFFQLSESHAMRERAITIIAAQLGVDEKVIRANPVRFVDDLAVDSIDLVELMMALEEEFGQP